MHRTTEYFGSLVREVDPLQTQQYTMAALGWLGQAVLGTSTEVDGFTLTPTNPASLNVILTPGQIYQYEPLEATSWSSLQADTAHQIVKQGYMADPDTIAITPPTTIGYSQVYLIEVQYADLDANPVLLPYFNAANPAQPFQGPGNSGAAQNTVRMGIAAVQIKAGVAATTGTQVTPTADAGWTGLFTVTVAYGQTTITAGNIATVPGAPFIQPGAKIPQLPYSIQNNLFRYAADTSGTAGALTIAPTPAPSAYVAGQAWIIKAASANPGAVTLNVMGPNGTYLGPQNVVLMGGRPLSQGDFKGGDLVKVVYDGSQFQMLSPCDQGIIDTALSFNVPGDFTDLNAAWAWLTRRRITSTGSVTFNLTASQQTYSSNVVLYHPDGLRVFINGATPTGPGYFSWGTITVSGSSSSARSSDQTANLSMFRSHFASELHFTGGTSLSIIGNFGGLSNVLITGDGTGSANGLGLQSGYITLNTVAVGGFSKDGFAIYFAQINGQKLAAFGNANHGFECYNSYFVYGGNCYALGNGVNGFVTIFGNSSYNSGISGSVMNARGNASAGLYCDSSYLNATSAAVNTNGNNGLTIIDHGYCIFDGANISSNTGYGVCSVGNSGGRGTGCMVTYNSSYGFYVSRDSEIEIQPTSNISSNGTWNIYAEYGANVYAVGTTLSYLSPSANTLGNGNAYIAN